MLQDGSVRASWRYRLMTSAVLCVVLLIVIIAFSFSGGSEKRKLDDAFAAGIDWSVQVNQLGAMPTAQPKEAARFRNDLEKMLNELVVPATAKVQKEQTVLIVARVNLDRHQYTIADIGGSFHQQCQLSLGGQVTLLHEDALTYLVQYAPPKDAHLTIDDCKGNETFFLAKKPSRE